MSELINANDFEEKVLKSDIPVMVDFFATWCGPCKMLAPVVDEIATEMEGKAKVYSLDIDQSREIADQYGIQGVPTLIVFQDGQIKSKMVGAQPKAAVKALFD